jgi:hypothetical protein
MKKLLMIASAGLISFITACNNSGEKSASADTTAATSTSPTASNSAGDKNIATVHAVNDAISSGDLGKLDQYIAANGVDHAGEHGDIKGLDSIKANLKRFHDEYKDMKLESVQDASGGDYVFSLTRFTGTNTVASMGAPAGTHFDMTSVQVVKFGSDGKATDHWEYLSMADAMKMMGAYGMHGMDEKKKK